jgi:two-component system response regulator RegX3
LIVDDETELAKMTAEYFEMFDIRTQYVDSAASCYSFFEENEADLILLDINLGNGSGFEVCKKIREYYRLPIIFISARQSDDDVLVALSIGGDDYVKKPYSLSVLLAKVKVNLKRAQQLKMVPSGERE